MGRGCLLLARTTDGNEGAGDHKGPAPAETQHVGGDQAAHDVACKGTRPGVAGQRVRPTAHELDGMHRQGSE